MIRKDICVDFIDLKSAYDGVKRSFAEVYREKRISDCLNSNNL
jgi:hypothetical protein